MLYMTEHLFDAIKVNISRYGRYVRLTNGRSRMASLLLISSEILSLFTSVAFDIASLYWQRKGVPLFKNEFVPMTDICEFQENYELNNAEKESLKYIDVKKMLLEFAPLINGNEFKKLYILIIKEIKNIETHPHVHCMLRHLLESFARATYLIALHEKRASELGVISPRFLCKWLLKAHLYSIASSLILDRYAYKAQKRGVPVIYQDVPHIPTEGFEYLL